MKAIQTDSENGPPESPTSAVVPLNRQSWIEQFCDYTKDLPSPLVFRRWAAIGIISAALERKCYTLQLNNVLYPNLFIFLVARPGVGKSQALNHALDFARETSTKVAPDDATKPALLDCLSDPSNRQRIHKPDGTMWEYHSMLACAHELGNLIKEFDLELLTFLSAIWDCPRVFEEHRRGRKDQPLVRIPNPSLTFLAGSTPGYLSSILPDVAWSQGFMARTILVYSSEVIKPPLFGQRKSDEARQKQLINSLEAIGKLEGEFIWSPDAIKAITVWYDNDCPPQPTHHRLLNYATRRPMQAMKIAMCFAAARRSMEVALEDFTSALEQLTLAESSMPEIFLEMSSNSDIQIIQELHHYAMTIWLKSEQPLTEARLIWFLMQKLPTYRHAQLLDSCHQGNVITRTLADPHKWVPNVAHQFGARK